MVWHENSHNIPEYKSEQILDLYRLVIDPNKSTLHWDLMIVGLEIHEGKSQQCNTLQHIFSSGNILCNLGIFVSVNYSMGDHNLILFLCDILL